MLNARSIRTVFVLVKMTPVFELREEVLISALASAGAYIAIVECSDKELMAELSYQYAI